MEYAGQGIRINTIALGAIKTPMHKSEAHDFLKSLQPIVEVVRRNNLADPKINLSSNRDWRYQS
ncbi:MAG: hypothetical protein JO308_08745 [Verrucomicrobia bacterium]|nr:hypothetical protein [Verrucomicrobiota bacterium]